MELLDRYLNAIRFLLPRGKQQDIIDELSEDLQAQIADKEAELGRPLAATELEAILKQCGHPLLVAGRYQMPQQLIGQPFYPLYIVALKAVLWVMFPLLLVIGTVVALFGAHPATALVNSVGDAVMSSIYIVGVLTVAFIVLEKLQVKLTFLDDWKPSELPKLPVVSDSMRIPRGESFGAFLGLAAFSLWWAGVWRFPAIPNVHFLQAIPAGFFWPVLVLAVAEMVLSLVNLFLPWWTRRRAAVRLAIDVCALAMFAALALTWPWFGLQIDTLAPGELAKLAPSDLARVEQIVNLSMLIALGVMALSYLFRAWQDVRRIMGKPPLGVVLLAWLGFTGAKGQY
jgi:ABC-type multidrug transport system fused ATPase/permease subunit